MRLTKEEKLKYVRQDISGERITTSEGYKNRRAFLVENIIRRDTFFFRPGANHLRGFWGKEPAIDFVSRHLKQNKELDNSDGKPYISASDYNFLSQMTEKETTGVINVIGTFCMKIIGFLQKIMRRYATSYKKTMIGLILYIRTLSRLKSN